MASDPRAILLENLAFADGRANNTLSEKQRTVETASAEKQAALAGVDPYLAGAGIITGKGAASASEAERDFRNLNPAQLMQRYGVEAGQDAVIRRNEGIREYLAPNYAPDRTNAQIIGDTLNTVAAAPVSLIGGIGALEAGLLGRGARALGQDGLATAYESEAGTISSALRAFTEGAQRGQSRQTQASRRAYGAEQGLDERDNAAQYEIDAANGETVSAGLTRIGRDLVAGLGNAFENPTMAADTVANAAGSLIGGGVISKTLQTIGKAATSRAGVTLAERAAAGRYLSPAESLALRYGERAAMPASIAAMEAGGAYQQTYEAAYEKLIAQGVSPDEAAQRANDASVEAAAIQGGVTAVTAPFLGGAHFERSPFTIQRARQAIRTALGETAEEGFQEASAQLAQNRAIQDQVDPNQSLTEGVGGNAALGAIGGFGSSAAGATPSLALSASLATAKLPFQVAGKAITYLGDRVEARNQRVEQSLADGLIGQAIAAGPEAQAEAQSIIDQAKGKSAEWRDAARGWVDRTVAAAQESETMQSLARTIMEKSGTAREKLQAAAELVRAMASSEQVQDSQTPDGLSGSTVEDIKTVVSNARQSDLVQQAAARGQEMMAKGAKVINSGAKNAVAKFRAWQQSGSNPSNTTAEANLQREGSMLADLATTAPESIDPDAADQILYHDGQKGFLTASQRQTLRTASELARARQKVGDEAMQLYGMKDSDARKVSEEVLTQTKFAREKGQKPSVVAHLRGIMSAYNAGDTKLAADRLTDLRFFAQHMGNKVGALNDALAGGNTSSRNPVSYKSLTSRRGFTDAENGLYISPTSESSVGIAQQIAVEAGTVAEAFNRLAAAFPDLGVQQVTIPSLDPSLQRPVADVVSDYAARKEAVPTEEVSSEPAETDQVENQGEESSAAQAPEPVEPVASEPVSEPEAQPTEAANESQTNADQSSEPEAMDGSRPMRQEVDEYIKQVLPDIQKAIGTNITKLLRGGFREALFTGKDEKAGGWFSPADMSITFNSALMDQIDWSNPEHLYMFEKLMLHELGQLLDANYVNDGSAFLAETDEELQEYYKKFPNDFHGDKFIKSGELYKEFKKLADVMSYDLPLYKYIESFGGSNFAAEFIAEAFSYVVRNGADGIEEDIPNVYAEIQKLIAKVGGSLDTSVFEGRRATRNSYADALGERGSSTAAEEVTEPVTYEEDEAVYWTGSKGEMVRAKFLGYVESDSRPGQYASLRIDGKTSVVPVNEISKIPNRLKDAHPNLIGGTDNRIYAANKLSSKRTVVTDAASPAAAAYAAFRGESNFIEVAGPINRSLTPAVGRAYQGYIRTGQKIFNKINEQLQAFADKPQTDMSKAPTWLNGQATNAAVLNEDGTYSYDNNLGENAVLAALQWLMKQNQYVTRLDEKDVRQILRLNQNDYLPETLVDDINDGGAGIQELATSLTREIQRFWGLDARNDVPRNWTIGPAEGMAKELIAAMVDLGLLEVTRVDISDVTKNHNIPDLVRYKLATDDEGNVVAFKGVNDIHQFPSALERLAAQTVEADTYVGTPPATVPDTQLRNDMTENTTQQKASLKIQQETPHQLNIPFLNAIAAMNEDLVLRLFGGGPELETMNQNDLKSVRGKNLTVQQAYQSIQQMVAEAQNVATRDKTDLGDIEIFFAYNHTVVNRAQMLGKDNPQSNKLMREAVLPTWDVVDMTDGALRDAYFMGLAQALGIKVHTQDPAVSIAQVKTKLAGFEVTRKAMESGKYTLDIIDQMKAEGIDSVVAFHAVMDYARYLAAEDPTKFRTAVYFEADGVVNGVTNALAMFSGGDFTGQFLDNMELGGFQVGEQSRTLAQIRKNLPEGKPKDLYEAIGSRATRFVAAVRNQYQNDEAVSGQFNAMNAVMNEFLPGISLTADGEIIVDRAAAKNPITITVYGSGANGIAGNLTNAIVKAVYARLSQANALRTADKSLTEAQAFMGGDKATAQARFDQLLKDMSTLMGREILVDEEGGLTVKVRSTAVAQTFGDMTTFTFPPAAVRSLQNNILHGFVNPLVKAIRFTLGDGLFENVAIIRDQVQVWSMLGQYAYALAYQERLAAERKKNPKLTKNDLLSRRQEEQVMKSVMKYLPHFSTGSQNYLFGMSRSSLGNTHFADGMTERMETRAYGYTPSNAGVSGIPGLTIGAGDGQAILNAVSNPDMPKKFLQIFDGIHSTIRDIMTMGKVANEAVFSSWQGDAFGDLTRAFAAMVKGINLDALSTIELEELARTLLPPKQRKKVTHEKIVSAINRLAQTGLDYSEQVSKRRQVLYNIQSSTDQMAGGGAPHQKLGIILSGSAEQKAAAMNRLMNEPGAMETAINEAISFKSASTGLMAKALDKAIIKMTPDPATRQLVRELVRSNKVDAYEIHVGTRQELLLKAAEMGINIDPARVNASGFVVPSKKAIFAVDGNMETIVHELIHAATYETLQAHYAGEDIGTAGKLAVDNLEGLMAQFKDAEFEGDAYQAALDEMSRKAEDNDRAGELNEFMAWALANADLASQLSQTKVSPLVRMARNVIQGIKSLLWGGKRSVRVSNDMFTNLRFNTLVVARSQPSTAEVIGDTILYHDPNYGTKTRLTDLNQRIQTKITDQDARNPVDKVTKRNRTNLAGAAAVRVMHAFEDAGFKFTAQDSATFVRVMAIMATSDRLDGNATARMQEIFAHVDKEMKVEDLLDDPNTATVQDYDLATDKLDALLGKHSMAKDAQGRSLILPAFMAAAMVDDSVRAALRKMTQPKTEFAQWNSLDNVLDNLGDIALNNVSRLAAGEKVLKGDQSEVLDELMDTMLDTELESQLYIEKFTNPIGNGVDKLNDTVVNSLDYVAKMAASYAEGVSQKKGAKRLQKTLADGMALLTGIFNKDNGETLAMAAQSNVNSRKLWTPLFELMTEMIGRTTDNAEVYDLIKIARAWVNGIRQQFREQLPKILNSKFSRELTDAEQTHLYKGLGLTDAGLLLDHYSVTKTQQYLSDERVRKAEIDKLITDVMDATEQHALVIRKAGELAKFMVTRKVEASNLLRNANAIAALSGVRGKRGHVSTPALVEAVDKLVSLMAIDELPTGTKTALASLVQSEAKGIGFMLSYLQGQNKIDRAKVDGMTKFNYYKGYMPQEFAQGAQLIVVKDALSDKESDLSPGAAKLLERGFRRLGAYKGSSWDPYSSKRGVYFASVSGRAPFLQGIAQNVQQTVSGVDAATGFTNSITGGTITDPDAVGDILAGGNGRESGDFLMPVFNENGEVYAFERSVDPALIEHLQPKSHMTNMMGVRSGRQSEETSAHGINRALVRNLRVIYDRDRKAGRENEYVDLSQTKDPVIRDAMSIFSLEMRELIQEEFPDGFMVRKDMINDSIGYRQASIGDAWTGNSRWSPAAQNLVKKSLMGLFGNKAFTYAVQAEQLLQNVIKDVRATIVIRSVIVPMANAASNVYQLMGRGVPVGSILRKVPKKTAEIESWHKSRIRQIEAEAELLAADTDLERNRLRAEIQTIKDGHKRLSIWPLLAAGEFSSVSDAGSREDVMLTQGKLSEYIERAVDKLPPAARTAGKYAIISKDTALFRALQKAVEYGDFVAKAVLYDDLRERKKLSQAEALAQITEEFVNYDRLPGRDRTYMEGIGLLWFWNFKVRSVKVAASMMKHNPLHSLITMSLPVPISGLGLPIQDNLWASLFDGRLSNSVGYGMAMRAPGLLPTSNLLW